MAFIISEFEYIALFKLLLASVCGGLIGLEREMRGRPAGLKTFSLVCLGSTLVMITNDYINVYMSNGTGDTARMAAQVISGIGFLGAGSIMVTGHNQIQGLTTAAALWVTASIGIAIGSGFYFGGLTGIFVIYFVSLVCRHIDRLILGNSKFMRIYVEGVDEEFMLRLVYHLNEQKIKVLSLQRKSENKWYASDTCATIELEFRKRVPHRFLLESIRQIEGFRYIEEI